MVWRRSIRIGLAPSFLSGPRVAFRGSAGRFRLRESSRAGSALRHRSSAGGFRPSFSRRGIDACTDHPPACPSAIRPSGWPTMHSTPPTPPLTGSSGPVLRPLRAPRSPAFSGQTSPQPAARSADGVVICGTLWGVTGGTQTHSRRTDRKLGQLRRARQELVRVPESNTKYGGEQGITGGKAAPVVEASISESCEIRNRKNLSRLCVAWLRPAVHRAGIFLRLRIA